MSKIEPSDIVWLVYVDFEGILCGKKTTYANARYVAFDVDELNLDPANVTMFVVQDGELKAYPGVRNFSLIPVEGFGENPTMVPLYPDRQTP